MPHLLLALVSSMVLESPSIKDQSRECSKQAALSITQLMKYNSVKHMRQHTENSRAAQHKSHLLLYWVMLHAETRKRLGGQLFSLGLSISYDQVLHLSALRWETVCVIFFIWSKLSVPQLYICSNFGAFT